ncbi:craniofacial development protein 2-like [Elysia marginata]|uniref:Craniofacial development protein 2-like n=1 Tax=Elysia marginata TaxID=1093978 RepID=A0AAV4H1K9_9GAST|nr:craniofacial development protein 2-like [Elysia marginata]
MASPGRKVKGQTRKKTFERSRSMTSPRHQVRLGAWNAQTMYEPGKKAQVISEMQSYRLNFLGTREVRLNGANKNVWPKLKSPTAMNRYPLKRNQGQGVQTDSSIHDEVAFCLESHASLMALQGSKQMIARGCEVWSMGRMRKNFSVVALQPLLCKVCCMRGRIIVLKHNTPSQKSRSCDELHL